MSVATANSASSRTSFTAHRSIREYTAIAACAFGLLLAPVYSSQAQTVNPQPKQWEFRISSGAFVPAGDQRQFLKDAHVTAAQVSWLVRPSLALTGTLGWARSRDRATADSPKLDVFTSDLGIELRPMQWLGNRAVSFSPFVGVGGGARSYNYRDLTFDARHNLAGYASAGGEFGAGRIGLRIEARDYVAGFKPLIGGARSETRNDVVLLAALSLNRRQPKH